MPLRRFRDMRDSHEKTLGDMEATLEAKEETHAEELKDLERKFLMDKGEMQKVAKRVVGRDVLPVAMMPLTLPPPRPHLPKSLRRVL